MLMRSSSRIPRGSAVAALLVLCAVLYVPPAVLTPFFTKGEPREALVVRRMVEEGDWVLPKRTSGNGWVIASKPPFFHWLGALASSAAGRTSEFTTRLPSLVLGTAAVLLVWIVGSTLLPPRAALAGAVVLATTFEWVRAVSSARVDGTLGALMTGGLLLFYRGFVRGGLSPVEAIAAYTCLICATLTKGPVGFVLPALVLGAALAVQGRLRQLPRFHPVLGGLLILIVAGGWYLAAWHLGGEAFVRTQVLKENVFRFLGASRLKSGHEHPFYYYPPTLAAGLLPWTPLVLGALLAAARSPAARREPRTAFLLVWFAVIFIFYSVASSKRSVYLLPLYPAAALLTGWWWDELASAKTTPRWLGGQMAQGIVALAGVAVALPLLVVLAEGVGFAPFALLAPLLHAKDQANLPIVSGVIDTYLPLVVAGLAVMLSALVVALTAVRREQWARLFVASATLAIALWLLVFGVFQPALARQRTLAPFFTVVTRETAGHIVYFYPDTFDFGAAFYAPPGVRHWRPQGHGPGPHYLLIWDDALAALSSGVRAELEVLASSEGTDPKGARHLSLVRSSH